MMYVDEVYAYYLALVQDADGTFLNPVTAQLYLRQGYDKLRAIIADNDKYILSIKEDITVTASEYDLSAGAVIFVGPNATAGKRLWRLLEVCQLSGTSIVPLRGVRSEEELARPYRTGGSYLLHGSKLRFSGTFNQTVRLIYVPHQNVDWTKITTTPPREWIDDLTDFHDLIALYACMPYEARDWAVNAGMTALRKAREMDLLAYLGTGRSEDSHAFMDARGVY